MPSVITIVNGWSDDNKGDAAVVQGLVELIHATHQNPSIHILSMCDMAEPEKASHHYRFTSTLPGIASILPGFIPTIPTRKESRFQRMLRFAQALLSVLLGPLALKFPFSLCFSKSQKDALSVLSASDIVISKGGHIFASPTPGFLRLVGCFIYLHPLLFARRSRVPSLLYGQSFGPFRDRFTKPLLRLAFKQGVEPVCREETSANLIAESLRSSRPKVTWDTAFYIRTAPVSLSELPNDFLAVTIRQWRFPLLSDPGEVQKKYRAYLETIVLLVRHAYTQHGLKSVFVPQVTGPSVLENDLLAWDDLKHLVTDDQTGRLKTTFGDAAEFLSVDLSPSQLACLYGKSRALIGTRFHSVILALTQATPCIAIGYYGPKTSGIMSMLGLDGYTFDIYSLDQDLLRQRLDHLLQNANAQRKHLADSISKIQTEMLATAHSLLGAYPQR